VSLYSAGRKWFRVVFGRGAIWKWSLCIAGCENKWIQQSASHLPRLTLALLDHNKVFQKHVKKSTQQQYLLVQYIWKKCARYKQLTLLLFPIMQCTWLSISSMLNRSRNVIFVPYTIFLLFPTLFFTKKILSCIHYGKYRNVFNIKND